MTEALRKLSSLAVVVPLFNEEQVLDRFYGVLSNQLCRLSLEYTIVFVDDGSSDGTPGILRDIAARDPRVTVLSLTRNWGHQVALTAGLDHIETEAAIVMDGDLQHPPAVLEEMIKKIRIWSRDCIRRSAGFNRCGQDEATHIKSFLYGIEAFNGIARSPWRC